MPELSSKPVIIILLLILSVEVARSQIPAEDKRLLMQYYHEDHHYDKHKAEYLFKGSSFIVKYNPVSLIFGGMMFLYQSTISPQFSAGCLYSPSCSNFSKKAISEFGLVKGLCLSADRLTRCSKLGLMEISEFRFDPETGKVRENMDMFRLNKP